MKTVKVLSIVAAALLVGAVALATLGPQDMSLGEALAALDHTSLTNVEHFVRGHLSGWIWDRPLVALLTRPVWLLPVALGLIFAGAAATAASAPATNNSRRRRS